MAGPNSPRIKWYDARGCVKGVDIAKLYRWEQVDLFILHLVDVRAALQLGSCAKFPLKTLRNLSVDATAPQSEVMKLGIA